MIKHLQKFLRPRALKTDSSSGQVAIILVLVISMSLIFYAVSLNLGRVSQAKTSTTLAANTASSFMASGISSYGQWLFQTELGGAKKKCDKTSVWSAILSLAIVLFVAWAFPPAAAYVGLAILGGMMAASNVYNEITFVQPGLTSRYNAIDRNFLDVRDSMLEQGIRLGLQSAATDPKQVIDLYDYDLDGVWGLDENGEPADEISRYGFYYNRRMERILPRDEQYLNEFLLGLTELVFDNGDGWGLYDGIENSGCLGHQCCAIYTTFVPRECHDCCLPDNLVDPVTQEVYSLRPELCGVALEDGGFGYCQGVDPYGGAYPHLFVPFQDNIRNNDPSDPNYFLSFREQLGLDDEHPKYYKLARHPNGPQNLHTDDTPPSSEGYQLSDVTGYYTDPVFTPNATDYELLMDCYENCSTTTCDVAILPGAPYTYPTRRITDDDCHESQWKLNNEWHDQIMDNILFAVLGGSDVGEPKRGIFPFLYKINDWDVTIDSASVLDETVDCFWYDDRYEVNCPFSGPDPMPEELLGQELTLPVNPTNPLSGLIYNTTHFVDWQNITPGAPPLAVDKVDFSAIIEAQPNECAQKAFDRHPYDGSQVQGTLINPNLGFWKRGSDRFCSSEWPYESGCAKHLNQTCWETDGDGNQFQVDCECRDLSAGGSPEWNEDILDDIIYGLPDFYAFALDLLSTSRSVLDLNFVNWYQQAAKWIEPAVGTCYLCETDDQGFAVDGILHVWRKNFAEIAQRIDGWGSSGFAGDTCTDVWCVTPGPVGNCSEVSIEEESTFYVSNSGVRGDIDGVVQCLDFNVDGYDYIEGRELLKCLNDCSLTNCEVGVTLPRAIKQNQLFTEGLFYYPEEVPFSCAAWGPGNVWYDAIISNLGKLAGRLTDEVTGQEYLETKGGNDDRFDACADTCSLDDCWNLPRSLIPPSDYDPQDFTPPILFDGTRDVASADEYWYDMEIFKYCLDTCDVANCQSQPSEDSIARLPVFHPDGATQYSYPSDFLGAEGECDADGNWIDTSSEWYLNLEANLDSILPKDEKDIALMLRCVNACDAVDCSGLSAGGVLPESRSSDGDPYPFDYTAETLDCGAWGPGDPYYEGVLENLRHANPSCDLADTGDVTTSGWLTQTQHAALEAQNQVAKFDQRRYFLEKRKEETAAVTKIFEDAESHLGEFLDLVVPDLIDARIAYDAKDERVPQQAIYGWQDDPREGETEGLWHIVKVEGRVPGRCFSSCNRTQDGPAEWPTIETETNGMFNTERCYELKNTDGTVKFRVTRFDENRPVSGELSFSNGLNIWSFRGYHPDSQYSTDASGLGTTCLEAMIGDYPKDPNSPVNHFKGAFMMDKRIDDANNPDFNANCWDRVSELLRSGTTTEVCSQYYYHTGENEGFGSKFVPCKNFF